MMRASTLFAPRKQFSLPRSAHWGDLSACQDHEDPDLWFAEELDTVAQARADEAKRLCRGCTVQSDCLDAALVRGERYGIWGGLTTDERNLLTGKGRKRSGREPAAA